MMHDFVAFNYEIVHASKVCLPAASSSALYGKGVFTTIAIRSSHPCLWHKHWHRLSKDAATIGIDIGDLDESKLKISLHKVIEKNKVADGRSRITIFDASSTRLWKRDIFDGTSFLIQTGENIRIVKSLFLGFSSFRVNSKSPLTGVKSCNYLDNLLAFESAKSRGFDEAIRLNERDEITSACLANIFWVNNGRLFTPHLETGCLAGTTRELILEVHDVHETCAHVSVIKEADKIFVTSAGMGLRLAETNQTGKKKECQSIYFELKKTIDLYFSGK